MSWLYRPSTPNAPSSALIAMISGITAATTVPNAISRIANVSGIVSRSDPSRSLLTTSLICSLASVFDRPWTWSVGLAAAIAVTVSPTGAIRWVRTSPSPFAVATISDGRLVRRNEPCGGRRRQRVEDLAEGRAVDPVDCRMERGERRDRLRDGAGEGRVIDGPRRR